MAIEDRVLARDPAFIHITLQARPQRVRRLSFSADADRQMPLAREHPDVPFELREKLDIDLIAGFGHVIAERGHGIGGAPLRAHLAQGIPGTGGDDAKIRLRRSGARTQAPSVFAALNSQHARLFNFRSGLFRTLQQHAVEIHARIDHQRIVEAHADFPRLRRGDRRLVDQLLRSRVIDQVRILAVGLIRETSAAGLLPRELLVEDDGPQSGRGQALRGKGSRRTTAQHGDCFHCGLPAAGG